MVDLSQEFALLLQIVGILFCLFARTILSLHRVFHSIRFKVNKVGTQRSPFFYALKSAVSCVSIVFVALAGISLSAFLKMVVGRVISGLLSRGKHSIGFVFVWKTVCFPYKNSVFSIGKQR
jgi:type III secretory pathway component EscU